MLLAGGGHLCVQLPFALEPVDALNANILRTPVRLLQRQMLTHSWNNHANERALDMTRISETKTTPYDVSEHLRTPEEMFAYLSVWIEEAPEDVEGIARALKAIARARTILNSSK